MSNTSPSSPTPISHRLSSRLLLYILLCSSGLTLVVTGVQLYFDYRRDLTTLRESMEFIRDSYLEPLAASAYNMDDEQLHRQLLGARKLPDIEYLEVSEVRGAKKVILAAEGNPEGRRDITRAFTLAYPDAPEGTVQSAALFVSASLEGVYQRLWDKALTILVSNGAKTFVASLLILLIIQLVVTRHLAAMAEYTRRLDPGELDEPLALNREKSSSDKPDELDHLVAAMNDMRVRVKEDIAARLKAERTAADAKQELLEQQRGETERIQIELEKLRQQLVNQTRLATIGQLAGSIAHELRNPLGAARNATYFLKRYAKLPEQECQDNLDIIEEEIAVADRIITDLMDMTRARPARKQDADLGDLIQRALERAILGEGVEVILEIKPKPMTVYVDPGQMEQVITNLVINSSQAMQGKGEIRISTRREVSWDEIVVRDNGPGVPPDKRDQVFTPLFTTRTKGTGLGLSICRGIIERHDGTIVLLDEDGEGAAFRIRLPRPPSLTES